MIFQVVVDAAPARIIGRIPNVASSGAIGIGPQGEAVDEDGYVPHDEQSHKNNVQNDAPKCGRGLGAACFALGIIKSKCQ